MWHIEWKNAARKDLLSLDKLVQKKILTYLRENIGENPRQFGKALSGNKSGLWRYRLANYRIICQIQDTKVTVLIVAVGHRKDIYD